MRAEKGFIARCTSNKSTSRKGVRRKGSPPKSPNGKVVHCKRFISKIAEHDRGSSQGIRFKNRRARKGFIAKSSFQKSQSRKGFMERLPFIKSSSRKGVHRKEYISEIAEEENRSLQTVHLKSRRPGKRFLAKDSSQKSLRRKGVHR